MVKIRVHRANQEEEKVFLNPQAQKDADAAETEALKNQLTKFLKELGRYTVWVLSITMITMVTRNSIVSHFTNQVVKNLIEKSLSSAKAGNIVSL